jgi:hypothetical protein
VFGTVERDRVRDFDSILTHLGGQRGQSNRETIDQRERSRLRTYARACAADEPIILRPYGAHSITPQAEQTTAPNVARRNTNRIRDAVRMSSSTLAPLKRPAFGRAHVALGPGQLGQRVDGVQFIDGPQRDATRSRLVGAREFDLLAWETNGEVIEDGQVIG